MIAGLVAALLGTAVPARAQLVLESVAWQAARVERGRVVSWQDVKRLDDGPPKLDARVRARVVLRNDGARKAEGVLLRYSMTTKLLSAAGQPGAGVWGIPFNVDARRVPAVAPNRTVEVPLEINPALPDHLRRLARAGWWPEELKIQAMLEPRSGDAAIQTQESSLEVRR